MFIKQILVGPLQVFSYLVGCEKNHEAIIIDPGAAPAKLARIAAQAGYTIKYIVNTHGHNDHTGGNAELKRLTGAKIVMHCLDAVDYPDIDLRLDKESQLKVGNITFNIIHTPGHTPGGICLYAEGQLFTGDTLFVKDSGRTDLLGGNRATLGASIRRLMQLPDNTTVWPGHDYGPSKNSTIAWEKAHNINAREYGFWQQP